MVSARTASEMRPLVAPLRAQRPPPSWPLFVLIEEPLIAVLPSFLRVEVVLRTPQASRRGGRTQPSCCSPPAGLGAPFVDEDHSEVVVRDLARVAHGEVGRDQAFRRAQTGLPLPRPRARR